MTSSPQKQGKHLGTVSKAMVVLEAFSAEFPEMGLSDIARRVKFDKATTLRLLTSLLGHGLIEKTEAGKLYRIGPAVQRLARIRAETLSFAEVVQPFLDRLRDETGESCHVSEASRSHLATVLAAHSPKALRINFSIGELLPFHCTASGVAYLAFAKPDVLERVAHGPLPRMTNRSKTRASELRDQVAGARARGYSINEGEYEAEAISVAAPVLDHDGFAFAAVSVAAPQSRIDQKQMARHGAAVVRAARDVTVALGGRNLGKKT